MPEEDQANMYQDYKVQALNFAKDQLSASLDEDHNYQTMLMLRNRLVEKGFDQTDSEYVVTSVHIEIDYRLFTDSDFMNQLVDTYADLIIKMHSYTISKFVTREAFLNYVRTLTIVFNL